MRVLVADDHSVIRLALRHILIELDPGVEIHEAANGQVAFDSLANAPVDLVVCDLFMPQADSDFVHRMVEAAKPAPVVIFSASENPRHAQSAITSGARGFVPKTTGEALIVNILRLILAGGIYLPPAMTMASSSGITDQGGGSLSQIDLGHAPSHAIHLPALTPRQFEVLELLAQGLSNADIGNRMGLNLSTVKSHVTGVLRALNVSSRTQAVLAFKQGDWRSSPSP